MVEVAESEMVPTNDPLGATSPDSTFRDKPQWQNDYALNPRSVSVLESLARQGGQARLDCMSV